MNTLRKIYTVVTCAILIAQTTYLSGQIITRYTKNKSKTSIGIHTGRELQLKNNEGNRNNGTNIGITINKPINNKVKIEAGLTYAVLRDYCCLESLISTNKKNITLPLTVQYFLFNGKNKIQPFIGAGLQYNIDATNTTRNSQANIESLPAESSTDKKYISLLFTQGITYEISTKIHITQSIHFIPTNEKNIGIDIGIGFNLR